MKNRVLLLAVILFALGWSILTGGAPEDTLLSSTFADFLRHPAIRYETTPTADPVAELNRRIQAGQVALKFEGASGYLRSLLEILGVPITSQVAVFAKDSVQAQRITTRNPRTIFFNDSVAVGWVRGGFIELASQDPKQGTVFYTLDPSTGTPAPTRTDSCLTCHYTYATVGVPGMLVRSVGQYTVDPSIPLEERWGGWYVTGQLGAIRHMGNVEIDTLFDSPRPEDTSSLPSLDSKFDTAGYLASSSDVAALMVFDHQMRMMNLLTRIGWEARVGKSQTGIPLEDAVGEVVDYMFFIGEAPIADKIRGSTPFAEDFAARGPNDSKGRSLRQLSLERRLMRYPCSYMIYSGQFDALPVEAREAIYRRMWRILSGQEKDKKYAILSMADRLAVVEILRDTKKDLPNYFQRASVK